MKFNKKVKRRLRNRKKVKDVNVNRFRITVKKSLNNLSAQIIDDKQNKTLVSASSIEKEIKSKKTKKIDKSSLIAEILAKRAKEKNINKGTVIDIKAPVVNISQFSPREPNNSLSFAVRIISLGCLSKNTSPTNRSFHTQRNWSMKIDAKAGIDNGKTILVKTS